MKVINRLTPFIILFLILSCNAYGQQSTPPPEALKACEGKKSGDASEFVGPRGRTVKGICKEVDGKLALQPDRSKAEKKNGPPPEALKACEGKASGDTSQFVGPRGGTVSGVCKEVDGKLVLQPDSSKGK